MSYANLIANKHNGKQQLKKIFEDGILNDQASNGDKMDDATDDFNEKDENFIQSHKKGNAEI